MDQGRSSPRWPWAIPLALLIAAVIGDLAVFVLERRGDLAWDDADYLARGLRLARLVETDGPTALGLLLKERPKPPFLIGWVEVMALIVGRARLDTVIVLSSVLPYGLLLATTTMIAWRLGGRLAALVSLLALVASPMGLALGAKVMVETFLGLWVLLMYVGLARCASRPTIGRAAFLGLVCGLAALTKLTVVLFALGPSLYLVLRWVKEGRVVAPTRRLAALGLAFILSGLLIAAPWYARNAGKTIAFARFSAQFDRARTGGQSAPWHTRWDRPLEQVRRVAGWPILALAAVALPRRANRAREAQASATAMRFIAITVWGLAAAGAVLLFPSYHDARFLLPIWPATTVVLGMGCAVAFGRASPLARSFAVPGLIGVLALAAVENRSSARAQPPTTTYWAAGPWLDQLVDKHGISSLGNLGNSIDWNVCKTNLINELRESPETCVVQHDLSKLSERAFLDLAERLDAVVVLDRSMVPAPYLDAAPAMNRGYESLSVLSGSAWAELEDLPQSPGLPPVRVFARARAVERE